MRGLSDDEALVLRLCLGANYSLPPGDEEDDPDFEILRVLATRGLIVLEIIPYPPEHEYENFWRWDITPLGRLAYAVHVVSRRFG